MLSEFLTKNRTELIERCRAKVAKRRLPRATEEELEHGIPLFLDQLVHMLQIGLSTPPTAMVRSATRHGDELVRRGFTVSQVIHDYGDLCQAVTELAAERDASITSREFGALNRSLDDAIAAAVTEHARQREQGIEDAGADEAEVRLAFLAHELRNHLNTAVLSFEAIKRGSVAINGTTSALHGRALAGLRALVTSALTEVRLSVGARPQRCDLALLLEEVEHGALLEADSFGVRLEVVPIEEGLAVEVDPEILRAVLGNLLQNAFKFTGKHARSLVMLRVTRHDGRVRIEIEDQCGGLPQAALESLQRPFEQHGTDRSGLGLGLTICQRGVEANDGVLTARDIPGEGCVFAVDLALAPSA